MNIEHSLFVFHDTEHGRRRRPYRNEPLVGSASFARRSAFSRVSPVVNQRFDHPEYDSTHAG